MGVPQEQQGGENSTAGTTDPRGRPQKTQAGRGPKELLQGSPACSALPAPCGRRYRRPQARQLQCGRPSHSSRVAGQRGSVAPPALGGTACVAAATPLPATATGSSNRVLCSRAGMAAPCGSISSFVCR